MTDTIFTVAFAGWVGLAGLMWAVVQGLINSHKNKQQEKEQLFVISLDNWLKLGGATSNTAKNLLEHLTQNAMRLQPEPDNVLLVRELHTKTLSLWFASAILLLVCLSIEFAISEKVFDQITAHKVSLWLCCWAIVCEVTASVWLLHASWKITTKDMYLSLLRP